MVTNEARCIRKTKFSITVAKTAFNREKTLFTSKLDLKFKAEASKILRTKPSIFDAETWTLLNVDQKYLGSLEM
jgi:hypothetical protein